MPFQPRQRIFRFLSIFMIMALAGSAGAGPYLAHAQENALADLPAAGTLVGPSEAFVPVLLKGMTIHPENPFRFDFIVDNGNSDLDPDGVRAESRRLIKYFLASLTLPQDELWVNLSPYEDDRIIPENLGRTQLGRDMLAQDYLLKQLTASLIHPDQDLGQAFWDRCRALARERFGTAEIPINTFNKVWIVPQQAEVYEHGQTVYIVQSHLQVMLEADYLAQRHSPSETGAAAARPEEGNPDELALSAGIVREIVLPEIEREVNGGRNFAPLRQIYHSLILARWYKQTIHAGLLAEGYVDQGKVAGVETADPEFRARIYDRYLQAYQRGVFDFIKEDYDRLSQQLIPHKYFSGGINAREVDVTASSALSADQARDLPVGSNSTLAVDLQPAGEAAVVSSGVPERLKKLLTTLTDNANTRRAAQEPEEEMAAWTPLELVEDEGEAAWTLLEFPGDQVASNLVMAIEEGSPEKIMAMFNSREPFIRQGQVQQEMRFKLLVRGLEQETDLALLADIIWALGLQATPEAVELLINVLKNDPVLYAEAYRQLAAMHNLPFIDRQEVINIYKQRIKKYSRHFEMLRREQYQDLSNEQIRFAFLNVNFEENVRAARVSISQFLNVSADHVVVLYLSKEVDSKTLRDFLNAVFDRKGTLKIIAEQAVDKFLVEEEQFSPSILSQFEKDPTQQGPTSSPVSESAPGGIDMNEIPIGRQGEGIEAVFAPAVSSPYWPAPDMTGLSPVIINVTPLPSLLPVLGLEDSPAPVVHPQISRR